MQNRTHIVLVLTNIGEYLLCGRPQEERVEKWFGATEGDTKLGLNENNLSGKNDKKTTTKL